MNQVKILLNEVGDADEAQNKDNHICPDLLHRSLASFCDHTVLIHE